MIARDGLDANRLQTFASNNIPVDYNMKAMNGRMNESSSSSTISSAPIGIVLYRYGTWYSSGSTYVQRITVDSLEPMPSPLSCPGSCLSTCATSTVNSPKITDEIASLFLLYST